MVSFHEWMLNSRSPLIRVVIQITFRESAVIDAETKQDRVLPTENFYRGFVLLERYINSIGYREGFRWNEELVALLAFESQAKQTDYANVIKSICPEDSRSLQTAAGELNRIQNELPLPDSTRLWCHIWSKIAHFQSKSSERANQHALLAVRALRRWYPVRIKLPIMEYERLKLEGKSARKRWETNRDTRIKYAYERRPVHLSQIRDLNKKIAENSGASDPGLSNSILSTREKFAFATDYFCWTLSAIILIYIVGATIGLFPGPNAIKRLF